MKQNSKSFSLISPATMNLIRAAWNTQNNAPWDFLHSYVYARWPYLYISLGKGEHPIAKKLRPLSQAWQRIRPSKKPQENVRPSPTHATGTIADIYHGKVMPLEPAQELVTVNEPQTWSR